MSTLDNASLTPQLTGSFTKQVNQDRDRDRDRVDPATQEEADQDQTNHPQHSNPVLALAQTNHPQHSNPVLALAQSQMQSHLRGHPPRRESTLEKNTAFEKGLRLRGGSREFRWWEEETAEVDESGDESGNEEEGGVRESIETDTETQFNPTPTPRYDRETEVERKCGDETRGVSVSVSATIPGQNGGRESWVRRAGLKRVRGREEDGCGKRRAG